MSFELFKYIETRNITPVERCWASLAAAILRNYIYDGCPGDMPAEWFDVLCGLANVNPDDLRSKILYVFGPLEEEQHVCKLDQRSANRGAPGRLVIREDRERSGVGRSKRSGEGNPEG